LISPLRILVAEDDPIIGFLLGEVLLGLGHEVSAIVDSERSAVEAALTLKPDLMIVDARLGTGSGAEAVSSIIKHAFIPHIFMSGDTATLRVLKLRSFVLEKPFQEADLIKAIQGVMNAPVV
jgi:CheY-like chemotaxis protein